MPAALRITHVVSEPLETLSFLTIPPAGSEPQAYELPFFVGSLSGLPSTIDAVVVASDLQGVVRRGAGETLLGVAAAELLAAIFAVHFPQLHPGRTLALLCGDLYADLTRRGQGGNPLPVWEQFAAVCGQVVGIAGNHDDFGGARPAEVLPPNARLLDNDYAQLDGLLIGGLSGIIGRSGKPFRRSAASYQQHLAGLLRRQPAVLLTHLSPGVGPRQGEEQLTRWLESGPPTVVCCGHSHWPEEQPVTLPNGTQVLNADTRVFILLNAALPLH